MLSTVQGTSNECHKILGVGRKLDLSSVAFDSFMDEFVEYLSDDLNTLGALTLN